MSKLESRLKAAPKSATSKARGATSKLAQPGGGASSRTARGEATLTHEKETIRAKPSRSQPSDQVRVRATTLRLQPSYEQGLAILKGVLKLPINKMVNEAVSEYIQRRTAQVERQLTTTLEQLQAYRRSDPEFCEARKAFITGEALYGKEDPMEGRIVRAASPRQEEAQSRAGTRRASAAAVEAAKAAEAALARGGAQELDVAGPATAAVRELLRG